MACDRVKPTTESPASTYSVTTIQFTLQFEYGKLTTIRHGTAGCPRSLRGYCPDPAGGRIAVIVDNHIYGPTGCDADWWTKGGYGVIRLRPK